jgi:hypothetical protein
LFLIEMVQGDQKGMYQRKIFILHEWWQTATSIIFCCKAQYSRLFSHQPNLPNFINFNDDTLEPKK